jgi:molecular chaperone DnaJ
MSKKDYYETLNLSKNASEGEIKKAYRKLAIKYHPDKNPGNSAAEQSFKEAAEAYEILSNPQKRQQYDQFGHAAFEGGQGFGGGGGGMSMDDIFDHFGDIFGSSFGGGRGFGRGGGGRRVRKGSNLRVKLRLSLEDIVNGVQKKIKVNKLVAADGVEFTNCSSCRGTGQVTRVTNTILGAMQTASTCPNCKGTGQMISKRPAGVDSTGLEKKETIIEIEIPAGVEDGMQLSMQGKGNEAPGGGAAGDLIIAIEEIEHEHLVRNGSDLLYQLGITFSDAVIGKTIEIPMVSGKAKIKIPSGTQSGKNLRLRSKGIPDVNGYGRGDMIVNIQVFTPQKISKEEKELLLKLNESDNFKPKLNQTKNFFERMKNRFA